MDRNSLALVNAASGSGQQSVSTAGDQVALLNREMIARVRQMRATGRVVLEMNPHSTGLNALPDMHLEDGDKLVVPFAPETVQVVGAVFNQQAFLYANGARVAQYLRMAGGPNRDADRRRMFVMRADGAVVGHEMGNSIFTDDFEHLRLYPGDAVVVPEKDVHPSGLNQLMIWSQFLTQLSFTALEANQLK
jgi:protein involved in polysaccharide export with SLBB domain